MPKAPAPFVLILGRDSLRADRALASVLKAREIDPADVVRLWGDECSFADVFAAVTSRSLFSDKTVVLVRRAEKLRGGGKDPEEAPGEEGAEPAEEIEKPIRGRKGARKTAAPLVPIPELDASSTLILVARKVDGRVGLWNRLGKVGQTLDAEYFESQALRQAAGAEARALGLRVSEEVLREVVEQSGPSLGRIVSEFEKMLIYQGASGRGADDIVAVTSSPPLYLLADALMAKDKRKGISFLSDALKLGEPGLKVLWTLHSTVRRLALFRALRRVGVSSADAGAQLGIFKFKIGDTERASNAWTDEEIGRALSIFAEADRRLKLSAPAVPLLTQALVSATSGGGSELTPS